MRGTASRAIRDKDLILEQQRLCRDGANATGAEAFHEDDPQVDGEGEEFAHGTNATMIANVRDTAPYRRIPSYCEFATYGMLRYCCEAASRHFFMSWTLRMHPQGSTPDATCGNTSNSQCTNVQSPQCGQASPSPSVRRGTARVSISPCFRPMPRKWNCASSTQAGGMSWSALTSKCGPTTSGTAICRKPARACFTATASMARTGRTTVTDLTLTSY